MGFYFRQSARLGPFRINFSKSGIGVSAGIPGFRIGTGPRGAYIHAGIAGLYYRQSLSGNTRHVAVQNENAAWHQAPPSQPSVPNEQVTLGAVEIIDSGSVLQMKDSTGSGLIAELERCRNRIAFAPWVFGLAGALVLVALWKQDWFMGALGMLFLPLGWWARVKDVERKGFVLQYELDEGATRAAADLVESCEKIRSVSQSWYMDSSQEVLDGKYHAGASAVVKRSTTKVSIEEPPYLRTNIPVPAINMGKETLYFLPDRLLVYSGTAVGAVPYRDLEISVKDSKFIESSTSSVPSDSQVVGRTWRYVNKKGGPDRRFKDNPELPIVLYEDISLKSATGLREVLQLSKRGLGEQLVQAITRLNKATAGGKVLTKQETAREGDTPAFQAV